MKFFVKPTCHNYFEKMLNNIFFQFCVQRSGISWTLLTVALTNQILKRVRN